MNCITNTEITRRLDHGERLTQMQGRYLALLQQGEPDQCAYCDIPLTDLNRTLDHIIPKAHRGTNHLDNLVLCCANCNRRKGAHTVTEFLDHWQSRITKGGGVLHAPSKPGQQRDGFSRQDEKPKKPKIHT